ncbi:MAG: GNAT family N-acetyltransferase [Betaproteobacteria bacterium]|nr:MAG: GNAT family N-acetyltransferase [Betaproteobacteria bacterium]
MIVQELQFGSEQYRSARQLRESVLRRPLGLPLSEDDLRGEAGQLHFAMLADQELVACVTALPLSVTEARIRQTAVAPAYQRQGVASHMMRKVEAILAARGYTSLSLHARISAIGFYRKLGYAAVGKQFIEVTVPHQKMVKQLT